jgi:hypothetical protein
MSPVYVPLPPLVAGDAAAAGKFTIRGALPLVSTVNLCGLPAAFYVRSVRYAGKEVPRAGFDATDKGDLEIAVGGSAGVLEGSVAGADGKPAGNAAILLAPASGPAPPRTGTADDGGYFYFGNLPPGTYRLIAFDVTAPDAFQPLESLRRVASRGRRVKLGPSGHEKVQVTVTPWAAGESVPKLVDHAYHNRPGHQEHR